MIYKFFDKSFGVLVLTQGLELFVRINNQPGNYTSPSLENFRRKVYSSYRDNVWVDDLADMLVIIKNIKGSDSCCVFLIFTGNMLGLSR